MAARTSPPFRADHVGSLLRPPALLTARDELAAGRIDGRRAARRRGRGDPRRGRAAARGGAADATDGEFRRARGTWTSSTRSAGSAGRGRDAARCSSQRGGRHRLRPPAMQRGRRRSALPRDDLRRRVHVPARHASTTATPKLTIPSPSMVHYRGGRVVDRRGRLPRPRRVLGRPRRPRTREEVRRLDELGCTLPAARRHQPRLRQRPRAARAHRRHRRRPRAPARDVHRADEPGAGRPARRADRHDAPLPRQPPVVLDGRGRLRLRGRGAVLRLRRGRLLPRVRRRALRRLRAAALRAAGQGRRARPRHDEARRSSSARTTSSAASTRPSRFIDARPAVPLAAVRVLLDRGGQRADATTTRRAKLRARRRDGRRGLGLRHDRRPRRTAWRSASWSRTGRLARRGRLGALPHGLARRRPDDGDLVPGLAPTSSSASAARASSGACGSCTSSAAARSTSRATARSRRRR